MTNAEQPANGNAPTTAAGRRIFGMTEQEWYAQGNPPGSFDDVFEMARENSETIRRSALVPHPWDEVAERDRQRKRLIDGPPGGRA